MKKTQTQGGVSFQVAMSLRVKICQKCLSGKARLPQMDAAPIFNDNYLENSRDTKQRRNVTS